MVRATPLAPDARRASIIAATIPLLRKHGTAVTTAQIAAAAGVAEGTLFRVFDDKESLIAAAIETEFDAAPTEAELAEIDHTLALRDKIIEAAQIIQARISRVWQLMSVLQIVPRSPTVHKDIGIRTALEALFAPHARELRCPPAEGARILRMLAFAGAHPRFNDGVLVTPAQVASVVLDGIGARPGLEELP
jgi:AcrR family transcriptional regulator